MMRQRSTCIVINDIDQNWPIQYQWYIESPQYMQDLRRESDSIIDSVACIAQLADSLFLRGFIICGQRLDS